MTTHEQESDETDGAADRETIPAAPPVAPPLVEQPDPVRLVASARFLCETLQLPPGIGTRDMQGFLEGEVEELSMFPLESTAWGYLADRRQPEAGPVLVYAAFREHLAAASETEQAHRFAVLPGFTALCGRKWRKATWAVLAEADCVSLVHFPARAAVPDLVRSRYGIRLDEHPENAWALRQELLAASPPAEGEKIEEGLIRCGKPTIDRRGRILFPLERQAKPAAPWKRFGTGQLGPEPVLMAADVRDRRFLEEERGRRRAVRQMRLFLRLAALALALLAFFQYQLARRRHLAAALAEQVAAQRPAVEALQKQEALAKTAARLSDPPLEIFGWLTAVNEPRPETVAFHTAYADRSGNLGFSGEAPGVMVVNQYKEALEKTGRCADVVVKEMNSTKQGVRFTLQVRMAAPAPEGGGS